MCIPQQWRVCETCDGEGHIVIAITVYEAGCGFPHDDTDERPCPTCGGAGGDIIDMEPDQCTERTSTTC